MVNIWNYVDASVIKLKSVTGKTYQGKVVDIIELEDEAEESNAKEDSIIIDVKGEYIGFYQSEIESIKVVE